MKYFWCYNSPLGQIVMESDGENLISLKFGEFVGISSEFKKRNLDIFRDTTKWLAIYFSGNLPNFTPKILLGGSKFQLEVWQILLEIPFGAAMTYGEIAKQIACQRKIPKMSAQAVGGAVGANPIAIIVPCHRVIGKGGKLTGYAHGLDKKEFLLNLENAKFRA